MRGLYCPTRVTPERFFEELGKLRQEAEVVVDRLISLMDAIDAPAEDLEQNEGDDDPDAEANGDDEPSLAHPQTEDRGQPNCDLGTTDE